MRFDADARARRSASCTRSSPAGELDAAVERYVDELLTRGADGRRRGQGADPAGLRARRPPTCIGITAEAIAAQRVSPEGQEGLRAFLEKRKPALGRDDRR